MILLRSIVGFIFGFTCVQKGSGRLPKKEKGMQEQKDDRLRGWFFTCEYMNPIERV